MEEGGIKEDKKRRKGEIKEEEMELLNLLYFSAKDKTLDGAS